MGNNNPKYRLFWWIGISAVILLSALNFYAFFWFRPVHINELGDAFGISNTIFSGLAFVALYISIRQQNVDLNNQRQEIRIQTKTLESQKDEMQEQNLTMRLQRFENTFFNMLDLHHKIVDNMEFMRRPGKQISRENPVFTGRRTFDEALSVLLSNRIHKTIDIPEISGIFNSTKKQFQTGHYFKNLLQILKFIDELRFDSETEQSNQEIRFKYSEIVRSQLSNYEMVWLFYQILSESGEGNIRPLVRKYSLFADFDISLLPNSAHFDLHTRFAQ